MNDAKPLAGKRIVVTRARHQAPPLADLIRKVGGAPLPYPCIAILPPSDPRPLAECLRRLDEYDWLLLTSGNSARAIARSAARAGASADWSEYPRGGRRTSDGSRSAPTLVLRGFACARRAWRRSAGAQPAPRGEQSRAAATVGSGGRVNRGDPAIARRKRKACRRVSNGHGGRRGGFADADQRERG